MTIRKQLHTLWHFHMLKYHATIKILFLKKNILENAYNCKKKNTRCKQSGIPILWGKLATLQKKYTKHGRDYQCFLLFARNFSDHSKRSTVNMCSFLVFLFFWRHHTWALPLTRDQTHTFCTGSSVWTTREVPLYFFKIIIKISV